MRLRTQQHSQEARPSPELEEALLVASGAAAVQENASGKLVVESDLPRSVVVAVRDLLEQLHGDSMKCGDSRVVDGYWIETHTIGCRREGDDPEAKWWDAHWAYYDKYKADDVSVIFGDPEEGIFGTATPQRPLAGSIRAAAVVNSEVSRLVAMVETLSFGYLSRSVFQTIQAEGLDEEQDAPSADQWEMATIPLSVDDQEGLMAFRESTVEKFNLFDIELKARFGGMVIDLIDYDKGEAKVVRTKTVTSGSSKGLSLGAGESITPWDALHIAVAEDDELSDAVITYVQENFLWSQHADLRDRLIEIIKSGPTTSKPLYRAEEPWQGGSPEGGQRGFRSWTAAKDTALYLGRHMCSKDFAVRTTKGAPVKALSIEDFAYWRGRVLGTAMSPGQQAEYLVLDATLPPKALATDVRWQSTI